MVYIIRLLGGKFNILDSSLDSRGIGTMNCIIKLYSRGRVLYVRDLELATEYREQAKQFRSEEEAWQYLQDSIFESWHHDILSIFQGEECGLGDFFVMLNESGELFIRARTGPQVRLSPSNGGFNLTFPNKDGYQISGDDNETRRVLVRSYPPGS